MSIQNLSEKLKPDQMGQGVLPDQDAIILPINSIEVLSETPRIEYEPEALKELVENVKLKGVLEPVLVQSSVQTSPHSKYLLISGYRRIRAAVLAGLSHVPARLIACQNEEQKLTIQLSENIQRQDLHPIEIARMLSYFFDLNKKEKEIANLVSKSIAWVSKYKKISKMPREILNDPFAFHATLNDLTNLEHHYPKHSELIKAWEVFKKDGLKAALRMNNELDPEPIKLKAQDIYTSIKNEPLTGLTREFLIVTKNQHVFNCRMQYSDSKTNDIRVILPKQYNADEMKDIFEKIIQSIHNT